MQLLSLRLCQVRHDGHEHARPLRQVFLRRFARSEPHRRRALGFDCDAGQLVLLRSVDVCKFVLPVLTASNDRIDCKSAMLRFSAPSAARACSGILLSLCHRLCSAWCVSIIASGSGFGLGLVERAALIGGSDSSEGSVGGNGGSAWPRRSSAGSTLNAFSVRTVSVCDARFPI